LYRFPPPAGTEKGPIRESWRRRQKGIRRKEEVDEEKEEKTTSSQKCAVN
jgi:predicted secreted Zn-dependent protease